MPDLFSQWREGLAKTSKATLGRLATLLGATEITEEQWNELEELLIQADMGIETTSSILESLRKTSIQTGITRSNELWGVLKNELQSRLFEPTPIKWSAKPMIIMLVGAN